MGYSFFTVLLFCFFGTWFIISVLNQAFPKVKNKVSVIDPFSLIPQWNFFAPNPGMHDFHLLYRDKLKDGSITELKEFPICEARKLINIFWNPNKRESKVLSDIVVNFTEISIRFPDNDSASIISIPYLIILSQISQSHYTESATHRQVIIVQFEGYKNSKPPDIVFTSAFHSVN